MGRRLGVFIGGVVVGAVVASASLVALFVRRARQIAAKERSPAAETFSKVIAGEEVARQDVTLAFLQRTLEQVPSAAVCELPVSTMEVICGYNPCDSTLPCHRAFAPIKQNTHCVFAKRARAMGSAQRFSVNLVLAYVQSQSRDDTPSKTSLTELATGATQQQQTLVSALMSESGDTYKPLRDTLRAFTLFASMHNRMDAFVVDMGIASQTVEEHGKVTNALLRFLSDCDPSSNHCMNSPQLGKREWTFEFAGAQFFVTTFSPAYGKDSSRYPFGVNHTSFVLFQPYSSFLLHGVGRETPMSQTNWVNPTSLRDLTRARFFESGMRYCIPEHPGNFPLTRHIVPRATYSEDEETGWPDWYSSSTPLKHSELL
eukprot:m.268276 g.268276  ORF g.268276 m.268276 type:complete len:372 (+) comp15655_c0_seq1:142-1257(+)